MKITESEMNRLLLKNMNDRPNAVASYGQAKMTPQQTKDMFDKQFEFLARKHNELCDRVDKEILGVGGKLSIPASAWDGLMVRVTIEGVNSQDAVIFSPMTATDKHVMNRAGVFINTLINDGVVIITATEVPEGSINLTYFIIRGGEP